MKERHAPLARSATGGQALHFLPPGPSGRYTQRFKQRLQKETECESSPVDRQV